MEFHALHGGFLMNIGAPCLTRNILGVSLHVSPLAGGGEDVPMAVVPVLGIGPPCLLHIEREGLWQGARHAPAENSRMPSTDQGHLRAGSSPFLLPKPQAPALLVPPHAHVSAGLRPESSLL